MRIQAATSSGIPPPSPPPARRKEPFPNPDRLACSIPPPPPPRCRWERCARAPPASAEFLWLAGRRGRERRISVPTAYCGVAAGLSSPRSIVPHTPAPSRDAYPAVHLVSSFLRTPGKEGPDHTSPLSRLRALGSDSLGRRVLPDWAALRESSRAGAPLPRAGCRLEPGGVLARAAGGETIPRPQALHAAVCPAFATPAPQRAPSPPSAGFCRLPGAPFGPAGVSSPCRGRGDVPACESPPPALLWICEAKRGGSVCKWAQLQSNRSIRRSCRCRTEVPPARPPACQRPRPSPTWVGSAARRG